MNPGRFSAVDEVTREAWIALAHPPEGLIDAWHLRSAHQCFWDNRLHRPGATLLGC